MLIDDTLPISRDDTGRKVIINSVSGALKDAKGTVIYGPHHYWFIAQTKQRTKDKKKARLVPKRYTTEPYWYVHVKGYNLDLHFVKGELKFI